MGSEAPAASGRTERAAVPCNSGYTAVPFLMLNQLHAVGFSIFNPAGLVKKDSRMGWTCPHYCLGISVMSTAPHYGCLFLPCPRESVFVSHRWFLSVLPVLGAIRWAITSHLCCLLAALPLSCQAGPASFIQPSRCLALEENVQRVRHGCTCSHLLWEYPRMSSFAMWTTQGASQEKEKPSNLKGKLIQGSKCQCDWHCFAVAGLLLTVIITPSHKNHVAKEVMVE